MNDDTEPTAAPDPVEREAAEIDPRSPDAPEQIEELIDHAEALGRDAGLDELPDDPSEVDAPDETAS